MCKYTYCKIQRLDIPKNEDRPVEKKPRSREEDKNTERKPRSKEGAKIAVVSNNSKTKKHLVIIK